MVQKIRIYKYYIAIYCIYKLFSVTSSKFALSALKSVLKQKIVFPTAKSSNFELRFRSKNEKLLYIHIWSDRKLFLCSF